MTFLEEIRMMFYRDEFSMLVEKWNAQRAQSVAQALMKVLYPQIEKEIKAKLLTEAKEHVIQVCLVIFECSSEICRAVSINFVNGWILGLLS
jgi:transcription elongation factor SPT6